jgi:hypothetical protein
MVSGKGGAPPRSEPRGPIDDRSHRGFAQDPEPQAPLQLRLEDPVLGNRILFRQQQQLVHDPGDGCQGACLLHKVHCTADPNQYPMIDLEG